jgi:hypothetical protein
MKDGMTNIKAARCTLDDGCTDPQLPLSKRLRKPTATSPSHELLQVPLSGACGDRAPFDL